MKKTTLTICFLILLFVGKGQQKPFSARVFDGITFQPLAGVSVYNMNTGKFSFTDKDGRFKVQVSMHDTLVFSKSIYRQLLLEVTDDVLNGMTDLFLYYKVTMLKEVRILAINPSYEGFKQDIIQMKLPDYYTRVQDVHLSDFEKANAAYKENGNLLTLGGSVTTSPITFLYEKFSRKSKMTRLYNEMLSYEDEVERVQDKYNREIVKELTGLDGQELLDFMMYCRFSYYDLVRWSDEDIKARIKNRLLEYQYNKIKDAGY